MSVPNHTPIYLFRMERLGLVTIGAEVPDSMRDEYELSMTDETVTLTYAMVRRGLRPPRIVKRTVTTSALSRELWNAAK